jgi:hypothetical protein
MEIRQLCRIRNAAPTVSRDCPLSGAIVLYWVASYSVGGVNYCYWAMRDGWSKVLQPPLPLNMDLMFTLIFQLPVTYNADPYWLLWEKILCVYSNMCHQLPHYRLFTTLIWFLMFGELWVAINMAVCAQIEHMWAALDHWHLLHPAVMSTWQTWAGIGILPVQQVVPKCPFQILSFLMELDDNLPLTTISPASTTTRQPLPLFTFGISLAWSFDNSIIFLNPLVYILLWWHWVSR